jgi:hypothetical protein
MRTSGKQAGARVALVVGVFAIGFVCGSVSERRADADMKGVMGEAADVAGQQGGALGAAAKLGTSIGDIQTHLDALNKDVETLRQIKSMLGG